MIGTSFNLGLKHPFGRSRIGSIYFIQRGKDGPIKIGFSHDVRARLRTLQTAHVDELHVLFSFAGSEADEGALHHRFGSHRVNGEWFHPHEDILSYIRQRKGIV